MKSKIESSTKGSYSVEHLHHFRCGSCNKWWSIGDPSIAQKFEKDSAQSWFCPWCGLKQDVVKLTHTK